MTMTNFVKTDHWSMIDEGFIATWNRSDGEYIKNRVKALKLGYYSDSESQQFLTHLDEITKRKWNDQKAGYELLEPIEASYKYDKITDYGLSLFCALIVGKPAKLISHMGIGDGVGETYDYQDVMYSERVRYAFGDEGYINNLGRTLRFHMTFDIMLASATFTEMGLFNNPLLGVGPMVSRSVFDPGVDHTSGYNYITGSYLITTLSA
jgi:hypothetical protein